MSQRNLDGVTLECVEGDITRQSDIQAIVNAANAELRSGGGVAGAIHRAAGPELDQACRPLAPIRPGQAVITPAYQLPNDWVVHCLGPVYGVDEPSDQLLADCYRNALQVAEHHRISSLAFPALSTGAFGYPMQAAAQVAFKAISEAAPSLSSVQHIRFVLFKEADVRVHEAAFGLRGELDAD
ncbi:macro domain-containing protein [Marinospirillum sp.]|uniref:macro domain-containing protein n=1 Tax=Marinospirillum sp. TaxID=2183934 RepID=UPI00287048E7|nr:macro domain-containing protein [Marinospirillum sp.]MDR9467904.1 macro domain-containing protein [Marinospirillum sp.]